jgi:cystathionine beta-lyase/cystathionine gamma-synthase
MPRTPRRTSVDPASLSLATRAIHGRKCYPYQGPVAPPIIQSSTYRFRDSHDAVRYAQGDPQVYVYSRYHNPTVREVEERLALMMRTEKALFVASGMAAIASALLAVVRSGDEIISTPALYGGTYRFFRDILPGLGIRVRYVRPDRLWRIPDLVNRHTRVVYLETPTNPTLGIVDIAALVDATRRAERRRGRSLTVMIDNTFASAMNQDPIRHGVDVILESGTKYLGGHSDLLAGVIGGTEEFVGAAHTQMKYFGGCADPFAAFLMLRSLKTFDLRVRRQNSNAMELARFLEGHPSVKRVLYPGLPSHPGHAVARRQMTGAGGDGYGGMVTIEVPHGVRGAVRVCDGLQVAVNAMSLGGVETLVSIPVYSSHISLTKEELRSHGVTPGMIRISVGVEGIEDLKRDFDQALRL